MKSRLTITLSESTLKKIDQIIDKKTIRNRSHAIEHLLEQSLEPTIDSAVILAGGASNRASFEPLTKINDKPLILYTLELLKKYQVTKIYIASNEKGKALYELLGDGSQFGLDIYYGFEEKPLGTGGALRQFSEQLAGKPFFTIAGDVLTTIDLRELATFHFDQEALVTMAVKPRPAKAAYDNVCVQGHRIVDFQESKKDQIVGIVNTGVYVFSGDIFESLPKKKQFVLEKDVFPNITNEKLVAFPFQGIWFDISNDNNYKDIVNQLD